MDFITTIKTLIFIILLLSASLQDIFCKHEINDRIPVLIFITAFIGFKPDSLLYMLLGMVLTALPLFLAALIKENSIGGADIKIMAAVGFMLGTQKGWTALIAGLLLAVVCTVLYRTFKHSDLKQSFPLVPYLSSGVIITYFLK